MYTQNLNNIRELLRPAISIPVGVVIVLGMYWIVHNFRIAADKFIILFFFVMLLVVTAGVMSLSFSITTNWEMKNRQKWPGTIGKIIRSTCQKTTLTTRTGPRSVDNGYSSVDVFTPQVAYAYKVNEKSYENSAISGPLTEGYNNRQDAENVLQDYPVGRSVTVYYSPRKPALSLLEKTVPSKVDLPFITGIILLSGGLFISWVLSAYVNNGCKSLSASELFNFDHLVAITVVPSVNKIGTYIEKNPNIKRCLKKGMERIGKQIEARQPKLHKPHMSKKRMNYEIKLFNDVHKDNEVARLSSVIGTYRMAHYFAKAIENSKKLIDLTDDEFSGNYLAVMDYIGILAEAGKEEDAEIVLRDFFNKWKNETEKEAVSMDSLLNIFKKARHGKPVDYSPAKKMH